MARSGAPKLTRPGFSLRGLVYQSSQPTGITVSAWPTFKGRRPDTDLEYSQRLWKEAMHALKAMDAGLQNYARENAKGTPMLPRDALLAALYGRGPQIFTIQGERYSSMANYINTSELLDNINWTEGCILYRGENLWTPLKPGQPGQALIISPLTGMPVWGNVSGGGGVSSVSVERSTDDAARTVWPYIVPFNSVLVADFPAYDPAKPTLLTVPQGATRARLSCSLTLSAQNQPAGMFVSFAKADGSQDIPGNTGAYNQVDAGFFNARTMQFQTPWFPANAGEAYSVRFNVIASQTMAVLRRSSFTMEIG